MKIFFSTIIFSFIILSTLHAQSYNDAGMWSTLNIEKKLKNNFSVFLTEELRLRENFSQINLFYTDIGVGYQHANILKVEVAYRSVQKHLNTDFYSMRHRLMLDITLKKKHNHFTLAYRQRFQAEVRNINSSNNGGVPDWYSRSKAELKYDLHKKYTPYASCELRYQINDPRNVESNNTWHRARYAVGFNYEVNKRNVLGLYYLIQREWNVSIPENQFIIGLEYSIKL